MLISGEGFKYSPAELQFYTSVASLLVTVLPSFFLSNWDKVRLLKIRPSSSKLLPFL
jgi:hypothetical protein